MLCFTLVRLAYLKFAGSSSSSFVDSATNGQWYWYRTGHYRAGFILHLGAMLPAGFLLVFQFIPIIRYKLLLFHRISGYVIILLVLIGNIGALMICRRAFGGSLEAQAGVGVLAIVSTTSMALAWYNIKRLQVDQHRKWMLRATFSLGTIITLRWITSISKQIISRIGTFDTVKSCSELAFVYRNDTLNLSTRYRQCDGRTTRRGACRPQGRKPRADNGEHGHEFRDGDVVGNLPTFSWRRDISGADTRGE